MKKDNPYHDNSMWKGAQSEIFKREENLRNYPTEAEKLLWEKLICDPFKTYHFRRQHPIHHFIADFYSHQLKLVIEVDGEYHESSEQKIKDQTRTELIQFQDINVIRFTNQQVIQNMEKVLKIISEKINS
ncbi:endonuclease domain-containing protein [Salinimicrobium sp. TH3]|uniref:endonuclease domain-containing protein n=1 Tax=Salinimicrobium sp. TH3 TaxID=2997342 RepID=UPI00227230A8|nr:endonuclease domain-containing protein [Salinimicrobium sp. TH3]MCY2688511.1 endonuclease domain-containing protein [Salinimicrobium sp. TH3]